MYKATTKDDVKVLAAKVESLAKEVQSKLDLGEDHLSLCSELLTNVVTMTFCLGEVYALEQVSELKVASKKLSTFTTKYNVRDSYGRFKTLKATVAV